MISGEAMRAQSAELGISMATNENLAAALRPRKPANASAKAKPAAPDAEERDENGFTAQDRENIADIRYAVQTVRENAEYMRALKEGKVTPRRMRK